MSSEFAITKAIALIEPRFRAGQAVLVRTDVLCCRSNREMPWKQGRILYPMPNGKYFVRIDETCGYAIVDNIDIWGETEPWMDGLIERPEVKVLFFGNGDFAVPILEFLLCLGYNVVGVVTAPDKPSGRGLHLAPTPVKVFAKEHGLRIFQPAELTSKRFLYNIHKLKPTVGVCAEFRKIPAEAFSVPRLGVINLHQSLLPMYRGASPIAAALKAGESHTGVTTILINDCIDKGDIINNIAVDININDTAESVRNKLIDVGRYSVDFAIRQLAFGVKPTPQKMLSSHFIKASTARKIKRSDCCFLRGMSCLETHNFIRAYSPTPGAWASVMFLEQDYTIPVKILRTSLTEIGSSGYEEGAILNLGDCLLLVCKDGMLAIEELQLPSRKRVSGSAFARGRKRGCIGLIG